MDPRFQNTQVASHLLDKSGSSDVLFLWGLLSRIGCEMRRVGGDCSGTGQVEGVSFYCNDGYGE